MHFDLRSLELVLEDGLTADTLLVVLVQLVQDDAVLIDGQILEDVGDADVGLGHRVVDVLEVEAGFLGVGAGAELGGLVLLGREGAWSSRLTGLASWRLMVPISSRSLDEVDS